MENLSDSNTVSPFTCEQQNDVTPFLCNDVTVTSSSDLNSGALVSRKLVTIFEITFCVMISGFISLVGSVGNIINIIVFCTQGFRDTINISLLGMSISDLGALLSMLLMSIFLGPRFNNDLTFLGTKDIFYLYGGWPHVCFTRITSWITAYVAVERCLCTALPLKVKHIITVRRTIAVVIIIFLVNFATLSPIFYALQVGPQHVKTYNRTYLTFYYITGGQEIENVIFTISALFQVITFIVVIICSFILIRSLAMNSAWRRTVANVATSNSMGAMSNREKRVGKMVTLISCIFVICFLPSVVNWLLSSFFFAPDYSTRGRYHNLFTLSWTVIATFGCVNSSINIIVYYNISSRYRAMFWRLFSRCRKESERYKSRPGERSSSCPNQTPLPKRVG